MKISGAEFTEWYRNHFPEGWYHDDGDEELFDMDTGELRDPEAEELDTDQLGNIYFDKGLNEEHTCVSVTAAIRRWRRERDFNAVLVFVPKDRSEEVRASLKKMGVKFT